MALSRGQKRNARIVYQLARHKGLSDRQAREVVAAGFSESGLSAHNVNRSSGAAGLFQLLSLGYRQRAQSLGGLFNPRANTLAILPDYVRFFRTHPGAVPGAAGAAVERSGMGAGFYSKYLGEFNFLSGGQQQAPRPGRRRNRLPVQTNTAQLQIAKQQFIDSLITASQQRAATGHADSSGFIAALGNYEQAQAAARKRPATPPGHRPRKGVNTSYGRNKGKLIGFPYQGTHTLYGNWESDRAVDIAMPIGTPVYATFGGTIGSKIGSLGKGGKLAGLRVHVDGHGDHAYYAHLSKLVVKPGQHVKKGQLLGYSGSANGVAHLHFATENHDPRSYLV